MRLTPALLGLLALLGSTISPAQTPSADGPDPREVPLPPIAAPIVSLPGAQALPVQQGLPDLLTLNDGQSVTTLSQWAKRRAELRRILAYYAVGQSPAAPGNVVGHLLHEEVVLKGTVRYRLIHLTFGPDSKLSLDIGIFSPAAGGPFPAIVFQGGTPPGGAMLPRLAKGPGQGHSTDALLPASLLPKETADPAAPPPRIPMLDDGASAEEFAAKFSNVFSRGYAIVKFNNNDCAEDTTLRLADGSWAFRSTRFFPAYPGYDWGILAAWAWGASRIADYLQTDPSIDATRLVITGASRNGKSSMIAAAFDDRFMAAPVVTGGGGIGVYRLAGDNHTETLDMMQKKYPNWFSPHLHEFWGQTEKLPFDEHWFVALVAPRPFIALEGDSDPISSPRAVKASVDAARAAYALYGAEERLAIHYSHHGHAFTEEDWTAIMDFADKHLGTDGRPTVYDVRGFGAQGDGRTKDTAALQKALDTCAVNGGGVVDVPAGQYLIGSLQIGAGTVLRLERGSVLLGSPDLHDYPLLDVRWEGRWQPGRRALIYSSAVSHTGIVGPGRIEGSPWGTNAADGTRNPVVLEPIGCDDLRWDGFTVVQGGNWATHPTYCTHVAISNLTITGKRDGIDVDSCAHVTIRGCSIDTGDDSISLKSGRGMDGARIARPCEDIEISDCRLLDHRFACLGIGSETSGGVRDVRIERCRCESGREAIYIKTRIGRAGGNEAIVGYDLEVKAPTFLRINLTEGGNKSTADDPVEGLVGYPYARNLSFSKVRVDVRKLVVATEISANRPVQNLTLDDITGRAEEGISLANMSGVSLSGIKVEGLKGPLLSTYHVQGTGLEGAASLPAPVDPPMGDAKGQGPQPAEPAGA